MGLPTTVTVGPLATADPDAVSESQTAAAAQYLVINGAKATGTFSANSICLSQTPSGALTLNGALANTNMPAGAGGTAAAGPAVAYLITPGRIYITCAGNNSGRTFAIVGTIQTPNTFGPGVVISETVTGANANVVSSSKVYSTIISITISGASTGAVTVGHGGLATLDVARHIIMTSGGDDTGITFTLSGTDWDNNPISEVINGVSGGAASSVLSYKTATSILTSGAAASTIIVGTNGVADSQWVRFDQFAANAQTAIQVTVSGTANYTVQQTLEDPNVITNQLPTPTYRWTPASVAWVNHPDAALVAASTTIQGNYAYSPVWAKVVLNSSSGNGFARATFAQAYLN